MPDPSATPQPGTLLAVVTRSLSLLRNISVVLDTYGGQEAHTLRQIIADLDKALPNATGTSDDTDFVVNGTFRVSRQRVSDLLSCALESGTHDWFRIVKRHSPEVFRFRTNQDRVIPHLDYPLNDGGCLELAELESPTRMLRLDLEAIRHGLTVMAHAYTRHFADFINENEDAITGDVFLQCCLLGEVVYG